VLKYLQEKKLSIKEGQMAQEEAYTVDEKSMEQLRFYSELLKKDIPTMVHEALEQYFVNEEKRLAEQDPMTNLSYDEFWDDLDI